MLEFFVGGTLDTLDTTQNQCIKSSKGSDGLMVKVAGICLVKLRKNIYNTNRLTNKLTDY